MISKLKIFNFQSHKNSGLEFVPGLNVIIGTTDSGKSAIIRALKWLITNRPLGDAFRSNWGGKTLVKVETNDGTIVKRIEGPEGRSYVLNDDDNPFLDFGTDVPAEIVTALNIDEINTQFQHDPTFLLTKTPGEVARFFNKIARLDKIDTGIANTKKWLNSLNSEITHKSADVLTKREELSAYVELDKAEADIEILEQLQEQLNKTRKSVVDLEKVLSQIEKVEDKLETLQPILELEPLIKSISSKIEERDLIRESRNQLVKKLNAIRVDDEKIAEANKLLPVGDLIVPILEKYQTLNTKKSELTKLKRFVSQIKENDDNLKLTEETLKKVIKQFEDNFPEVCPLCGTNCKEH